MNLEISTINTLLASVLVLQAWIIRKLFQLENQISVIRSGCRRCPEVLEDEAL
jgi:hypothetical protein